ncbi:MAG: hypothetical protein H0X26_04305 [Alphaproteobacteria bacterium]|nr:hypothetical protein [Alphaproteobacteria bacterium]
MQLTTAEAARQGTNTSNLFVNIAGQGTGTLTGDNIDDKLVKADRLLAFEEQMVRDVNSSAENTLFSAGEIDASWVYIEILRTQASIFVQNSFYQANNITPITIYRGDIINGKITVTEEIEYQNCIITRIKTEAIALDGKKLDSLKVWFRFTQRQDTLISFDQEGKPLGNNVSLINFVQGTLKAAE